MSDTTGETLHGVGRRAQTKAFNRQAILDAARRVFARLGFEATTIRDIIRDTGLASGTFYNYFQSKEAVFEALEDDGVRRFRPLLRARLDKSTSFEELVHGSLLAYFRFVAEEHSEAGPLAGITLRHGAADTPETRAIFQEVRTAIETAVARGTAPPIDADYFTAGAIGLAREVCARMLLREPLDLEGAAGFCTHMLLGGAQYTALRGERDDP